MKKIILAPDSFKGTMSSIKICAIMEKVIKQHFDDVKISRVPIADGGEGTVECFLHALGGSIVHASIKGPYFDTINSFYGITPDGKTAVIEMAAAAGLPLVEGKKNPADTTTYGVGQLIHHAIEHGCTHIILGLGGSSTNDGGTGMAAALGIKFLDNKNQEFIPTGGTMNKISKIDTSDRFKRLDTCNIIAMCDVNNTLFGQNGAAYVFASQKGADTKMIHMLDENLQYLSKLIIRDIGMDISKVPGTGAAGGMGAGAIAFLGAELKSGIETILNTVEFDKLLNDTDFILTGEGKLDNQSLFGKAVVGIARRAKSKNVPVFAIVGDIGEGIDDIYQEGVTAVLSINRAAMPFDEARNRCENDLALTIDTLMRIIKLHYW